MYMLSLGWGTYYMLPMLDTSGILVLLGLCRAAVSFRGIKCLGIRALAVSFDTCASNILAHVKRNWAAPHTPFVLLTDSFCYVKTKQTTLA